MLIFSFLLKTTWKGLSYHVPKSTLKRRIQEDPSFIPKKIKEENVLPPPEPKQEDFASFLNKEV